MRVTLVGDFLGLEQTAWWLLAASEAQPTILCLTNTPLTKDFDSLLSKGNEQKASSDKAHGCLPSQASASPS